MAPSLSDLNLPHNPFNVLGTMAVIRQEEEYSAQNNGALWSVSNLYAPNEFEHHWKLGDAAHNHKWQYILFWGWA